jgi:hypothetical protein
MLTRAGKDHEGRKMPPNDIGNVMEFEHGKRDGVNISKVRLLFSFSLFFVLSNRERVF